MTAFAPPVMPGAPKPLPGQTDTIARFDLSAPLHPAQGMDPSSLTPEQWAHVSGADGKMRDLIDVATVIGSAYAVFVWLNGGSFMLHGVRAVTTPSKEHLTNVVTGLGQKYRTAFTDMVLPALRYTITAGTTGDLSYEDKVVVAQTMSHQIFDYVNDTSAKALVDAYNNQLAQKWSPEVAWARVAPAYGLEPRSMNQYLKLLSQGEGREILPTVAKDFAARAIQARAERIGATEAYRAHEMGKTIVWLSEYRKGALPKDIQRKWRTAADEKVCSICGPMDLIQVPMTEQFELPDGNKVWAPGVHPNCRCSVELSYPEFDSHTIKKRTSTYDPNEPRNDDGEWTRVGTLERATEPEQAPEPAAPTLAPTLVASTAPTAASTTASASPTLAPGPVSTAAPTLTAAPVAQSLTAATPTLSTAAPTLTVAPTLTAQTTPTAAPALAPTLVAKPTPLRTESDADDAPMYDPRHWYVLANDYAQADPTTLVNDPWGESDYDMDRGTFRSSPAFEDYYKVGEYVDFDNLNHEMLASPVDTDYSVAEDAANKYEDNSNDDWEVWLRNDHSAYIDALEHFHNFFIEPTQMVKTVHSLRDAEIRDIYHWAGDNRSPRQYDMVDLRADLINRLQFQNAQNQPYQDAYLHVLEKNHPDDELKTFREMQDQQGLTPHTVQVLTFVPGAFTGNLSNVNFDNSSLDRMKIRGRYQIVAHRIAPLRSDTTSQAYHPEIENIEYLYLAPAPRED